MRKVEHRLRLDLLRGGNQGYIRVKRGENGARRLAIALYMHSVPYMADAGTTAVFRAIKPDNTKLFNSATITDNVVTVGLTTQTVAALGTVRCELSIYGTNNELLYSPQFDIIVEDYLYSDTAIESTDEYTDLTEAISKVNNIVSTEAARVAAENQRVANETARVSAESERASAETARAEAETARATAETERASAETTRASAESSRAFSENIRKQAEKQRVSSETQRDTAETDRSTAESGRRSAETARVQEFNAIKADAQDAATAEATRALAEELRMALYNQWDNATASVKGGKNIDVNVVEADGHKNFDFTIPSDSLYCETRTTITNGDLETIAREHARTIIVFDLPLSAVDNKNPTDYGLPADIAWNFTLINGPSQNVGTKNYLISYPNATVAAIAFVFACPQTLIDGNNIYMRRLSYWDEKDKDEVSHWKFEGEDWEPVGGTADAVTYTPQTLTTEQQKQARTNIGAGQPIFTVNVTEVGGSEGYTADKTAAEIEAAYQAGRTIVCKTQARFIIGYIPVELPLVSRNQERVFTFAVDQLVGNGIFAITVNISDSGVEVSTRGVDIYENPTSGIPKSDLAEDVQTSLAKADTAISLGLTAATPGQIIKVKTVQDGKPTEWEAVDMPSGGGGTKMEEVTETVTVGSENVTLNSGAPSQTVNLAWNVSGGKTIPPFTNYYIEKSGISYPRTFDTKWYTQFWSSSAHGNLDAFVSGHKYFQAFHYAMDGESTAEIYAGTGTYITPTNNVVISGSGWVYMLSAPSNAGAVTFNLKNTSTGTGTIDYLYCIDVTALQEAGTITATTINELAELFGGLELIPGQDYAGSTTSGVATLSITRDGETTTVDSGTATATVQGGDILSMEGGSVTFLLKVLREVYVDPIKVWAGKKWVAFGDSLTDETINADKKYYRYIEEKTGITVVVMGKGSTGYYKGYDSGMAYGQRMANVTADADVITIFGSVNDWHTKNANVEMGNASDTVEAGTLAGYINECIDVAIEKAPYAQIALVTPMDYHGLADNILEGIANIIKAVAAYRKIKCLDLYHESGFRVDNPTFAAVYTTDYSETAESYGHPSNLAHEQLIAPEFMELLKRMLLTA